MTRKVLDKLTDIWMYSVFVFITIYLLFEIAVAYSHLSS